MHCTEKETSTKITITLQKLHVQADQALIKLHRVRRLTASKKVLSMSYNALSYLRKESLDIFNRIQSIEEDVSFVRQVNKAYPGVPIVRAWSYIHDHCIYVDINPISQPALWRLVYRPSNRKLR